MADDGGNNSLLWRLGLKTGEFEKGLQKALGPVAAFGEKLNSAFQIVQGGFMLSFLDKLISKGAQIQSTADSLGVTTDHLQALEFAARDANVPTDKLQNALYMLGTKSAEAASGNKQAQQAIKDLGLDMNEFLDLPVDQKLEAVAKGFSTATDQNVAMNAAVELLGAKNAPRLVNVLRDLGEKGLDGVTEKAKTFGQVISEEAIGRMEKLGNVIDSVKNSVTTGASIIFNGWGKIADILGTVAGNIVNVAQGLDSTDISAVRATENLSKHEATVERINVALKGTKATTEELQKAQEAQAKAAEDAKLKEMSDLEKVGYYQEKVNAAKAEQQKWDAGTREWLDAQKTLNEANVQLAELELKSRKELNDETAKNTKDFLALEKARSDYAVSRMTAEEKTAYYLNEQSKNADALKKITAAIAEDEKAIDDLMVRGKDATDAQKKLQDDVHQKLLLQNDALGIQKNLEKDITGEKTKQLGQIGEIQNKLNQIYEEAARANFGDIVGHLTDYGGVQIHSYTPEELRGLSEPELQDIIKRSKEGIAKLEADKYNSASTGAESVTGFAYRNAAEGMLANAIDLASRQLSYRSPAGSPAAFNDAVRQGTVSSQQTLEQIAQHLATLDQRFSYSFPANGVQQQ